ncbi:hypothetical protein DLJ53_12525 [Acuticoccus sediminis]|uniref:DUF112 domain-containing protein n=1 Tax=Acuticoccus sediminis TaxID=2184697 RepID=A0A8B2NQL6_9HYPH|nr:tripartite tricarboxylate transporter permease [Acuticoccus sediminis]RAI02185.1 hypothetical protein DLJ53_12525 [Acuticoccus sediminis]
MILDGLGQLLSDPNLLALFAAGVLGGCLFGAIPGVNMLTLGAVLLPFTAQMVPSHAIMLYGVIYCSGVFGGAITAILFNIPGAPENAPTAIDGYKLTLKGEASRAVGAAVLYSALGGIVSCILMIAATPLVAGFAIRAFGPPEVFALILFGLAISMTVGAASPLKGALSVGAGLLIATIGSDPADGVGRYDFGSYYLLAGIHFIPVLLGLFAVSEVLAQLIGGAALRPGTARVGLGLPRLRELWAMRATATRSAGIGLLAGVVPGIGAVLAAFLSYSAAARLDGGRIGEGDIRGVVASETANNAATGSAMIPLLALGLPGGALTAMMLSVFQIHGIVPGPLVFATSTDLVGLLFAGMLLANVAIFGLGWLQTKTVVHILRIPFHLLAPAILVTALVGAYALRNLVLDVWVMAAAGVVGLFIRRTGYSIPGLVLGLVLGGIGESSFSKAMQMLDYQPLRLLERPLTAAFLALAAISFLGWTVDAIRSQRAAATLSRAS